MKINNLINLNFSKISFEKRKKRVPRQKIPYEPNRDEFTTVTKLNRNIEIGEPGASQESRDRYFKTAISIGSIPMINKLIQQRANLNKKFKTGYTPLNIVLLKNYADAAMLLIQAGANVNIRTPHSKENIKEFPINIAARCSDLKTVKVIDLIKAMVDKGANINARDERGDTPLHTALIVKNKTNGDFLHKIDTIRGLLKLGADPTIKNDAGETPADYAAKYRYEQEVCDLFGVKHIPKPQIKEPEIVSIFDTI